MGCAVAPKLYSSRPLLGISLCGCSLAAIAVPAKAKTPEHRGLSHLHSPACAWAHLAHALRMRARAAD